LVKKKKSTFLRYKRGEKNGTGRPRNEKQPKYKRKKKGSQRSQKDEFQSPTKRIQWPKLLRKGENQEGS